MDSQKQQSIRKQPFLKYSEGTRCRDLSILFMDGFIIYTIYFA